MFRKYVKGGLRIPESDFEPQFLPTAHLTALRPCLADGKPATFHRWIEEEKVLLKINVFMRPDEQLKCIRRFHEEGVFDNCCSTEKARACAALVEYPDGSVGRVKPELIQFLDRKEG